MIRTSVLNPSALAFLQRKIGMSTAKLRIVLGTRKIVACLGLASLILLCGCSRLRVKLGLRVDLTQIPVTSMEASLPSGSAIAPGEKSPLVVTFTDSTGKVWVTEGKGKGKVQWNDLTVTTTVVTMKKKGVLSLSHDPRVSDGKIGHITITAPSHPTLRADLDIPLSYAFPFVASYSGRSGLDGTHGTNGTDGSAGSMGSIDPNNPSPGGDGGNGPDGSKGGDGDSGGDGPPVQVRVMLRPGAHPLLQVGVAASGHKERFYLVDPQGGSLTIKSEGGAGGSGGKGGSGGHGGSGGAGTPAGNNGSDGSDGLNGSDGRSGDPGLITVTYDPQAKPYLSTIRTPTQGRPAPVYNQQTVAPLW
jgi:hypothetical protein